MTHSPILRIAGLILLAAVIFSPGASAQPADHPVTAIVGADVLPMTGTDRLDDQTVVIAGDRIVEIGPQSQVRVPPNARVVDGSGRTLMPGLVDMHVHLAPTPGAPGDPAQRAMAVMLGHGVTTARSMAGSPQSLEVRASVERGDVAGPRLYAASPALNFQNTPSPESARKAVAEADAAEFDLIKSHHLPNVAVWQALQDESKARQIATAGHVANEVGLARALAANQQIEHLDSFIYALLPEDAPERQIEFGQVPPPTVVEAAARASDERLGSIARRVAAARGHQVPTLSLFERITDLRTPTDQLLALPEMRFVPDPVLEQWAAQHQQFAQQSGYDRETAEVFRKLRRRIVAALHKAGVPIMVGSDTAQSFHLWGPATIAEIEALHEAGLSKLDALRSATVVPRNYFRSLPGQGSALGWKADFGTVEKGARADVILVRGDPSEDLDALRRVDTVIAGGKLYERAELDRMLDSASEAAKGGAVKAAAAPAQQVYVMRHLEAEHGGDPSLTSEGQANARRLASFLGDSGISAVFVTPTQRAQQTAMPLASRLGLTPVQYDPSDPAKLVAAARAVPGNVLIVGHSNTVPDIVGRLGGNPPAPIGAEDFGTLWRVDSGDRLTRVFPLSGPQPALLAPCKQSDLPPGSMCGAVAVPENRDEPGGRTIDVHFAVVPAAKAASDAPLVVLPGGPGLGGVQGGGGVAKLFAPMLDSRDLLLIDQRGTGESNRLGCPQGDETLKPIERARACLPALSKKADLSRYHTREAVLDMEAVRASLGYPALDLFGMSYGSRPALDYLRLFPANVGETVIRAAAPTSMKLPLYMARDAQIAFDRLVAACNAQPDCAARYPNTAAHLKQVIARVRKAPVPYTVTDPKTGAKKQEVLTADELYSTLFFLLYIEDFYVHVPALLDLAAGGNFSPMMQAVAPFTEGTVEQIAWGMRWSVICDEDVRRITGREVESATSGTFIGPAIVRDEIAACKIWPRAKVPADYFAPVRSTKPVLILSGEMDPVAGRRWGEEIARTLPNSRHIEIRGASHLPPLPGCTLGMVENFLDGKPLGSLEPACAEQRERPSFKIVRG